MNETSSAPRTEAYRDENGYVYDTSGQLISGAIQTTQQEPEPVLDHVGHTYLLILNKWVDHIRKTLKNGEVIHSEMLEKDEKYRRMYVAIELIEELFPESFKTVERLYPGTKVK